MHMNQIVYLYPDSDTWTVFPWGDEMAVSQD